MSSWTEVEIARHASAWRLLSDVTYHVGGLPSPTGWRVHVPAGFVTDLATVPLALRWIVDRDDLAPAAVLHDWLLHQGAPRALAALVFREAALATPDCPRRTAWLGWLGVRFYDLSLALGLTRPRP